MKATFIRLISNPAGEQLQFCIRHTQDRRRFRVDPRAFAAIPGSPFAYWAGESSIAVFADRRFAAKYGAQARQGLSTTDDNRFVRLSWEIDPLVVRSVWRPFSKGGRFSSHYDDIYLLVNWAMSGVELYAHTGIPLGGAGAPMRNPDHYFRSGLTWPRRTNGFSIRVLPRGCVFGDKGPALHVRDDSPQLLLALDGVLNSLPFRSLMALQLARTELAQSFEIGIVESTPLPDRIEEAPTAVLAHRGWSFARMLDTVNEVSHAFVVPAVLQVAGDTFGSRVAVWSERVAEVEAELARVQSEIDELCFELYGISDEDRRAITEGFGVSNTHTGDDFDSDDANGDSEDEDAAESEVVLDPVGMAAGLVSWAVGVAVGRFDVRLATGEREWPVEPDPFDPLPVCSPGLLTGDDGLPVVSLPAGYPVVPSPVLVDDPGHELDLAARVRTVFDVVFGGQADVWWSDVGAVLDPRNGVEGWLRRGFFDQHLKTYSKSRRKAPVMWPIGTRSGSYRVWLYAHQVNGDTLFRVLEDVVEPKLATEQRRLSDLTQEFGPSPAASQRRTLEAQQPLVNELIELRNELRAVAPLWHPNLNDGIVLVLAPLWRLFAHHRAWSKELRDRWAKLAKGEYDWAQLAMHIWPERVVPKCADDRSLAIAHDLQDTFWAQDDTNPDKWHPRQIPTTSIVQLIDDRTNPTIYAARTQPTP